MLVEGAMIDLIEQHRAELEELCRKYRVQALEVFGSAADFSGWEGGPIHLAS
jgi:predicted nucleotidyltransferase